MEPFGGPGLPPNWTTARKNGVGTSATRESKVWFTLADGVITEVYYPTVDVANVRDLQFLVTDGKGFFDSERADTDHVLEYTDPKAIAYTMTNTARSGRYRFTKRVATDPERNALVMRVAFEALEGEVSDYRVYLLFAPHIKNRGYDNSGRVAAHLGRGYLTAWREDAAAALTADAPMRKCSVGYAGSSDGWQDLKEDLRMDWSFDGAEKGNIALMAELDLSGRAGGGGGGEGAEFTLCLSFGSSVTDAMMEAAATMGRGYAAIEKDYISGWRKFHSGLVDLSGASGDGGRLFRISAMVLKAHEDKTFDGVIASLSIPWGQAKGDKDVGGYHLVWPRDLANAAFAFMAMGELDCPVRILKFLARTQKPDGSWPQNMWLDGRPYWPGIQLDEVAFPVLLAWRLKKEGVLGEDYYLMVKAAAGFLVRNGPVTEQERWEENGGFSPSTLAAEISALVTAALWAREKGEAREAEYLLEIADYWSSRVEEWTFSECECLGDANPGHFLRIVTEPAEALADGEEVCHVDVFIKNLPADAAHHQGEIVDAGFLELVRYGVRLPEDDHITRSLSIVDRTLRKEMDYGPLFYRYNGDGYGEKPDGGPFDGSGVGRPWPLLSGERGMYEVMAGRSAEEYVRAMEGAANEGGMIPEQVWDMGDLRDHGLLYGRGTGAATPLMWAHAEYIKLLRSRADGAGCDVIAEVRDRYSVKKTFHAEMSAWKVNKPIKWTRSTHALKIVSHRPGTVVWTTDGWSSSSEAQLRETGLGVWHVDFGPGTFEPKDRLVFTFRYGEKDWEGVDYGINIV